MNIIGIDSGSSIVKIVQLNEDKKIKENILEKQTGESNVIDYYVLCNKLKNVIRTGWKDWNVQANRLESVGMTDQKMGAF